MKRTDILEPSHPEGRPLSDFERSLWRLKMVSHEVQLVICSVTRNEERKQDDDLLFSLTNHGLLLVCKFMEVWDEFCRGSKDNRRILEATRAVAPAVRRITKTWPRVREYRNWAIGHPYRIGDEKTITPPWALLIEEVAPFQPAEIMVLLDCVRFSVVGVLAYFGDFYRAIHSTLDMPEKWQAERGVRNGEEAEAERRRIALLLNERLSAVGVDLTDPVFLEYRCLPPDPDEEEQEGLAQS